LRRVRGVRRPNSRKIAEPCPRHRCDKGKPVKDSRNVRSAPLPSLLAMLNRLSLAVHVKIEIDVAIGRELQLERL
jgi:hypothetical protein